MKPKVTQRARNLRSGRVEMWKATSEDGRWVFDRIEESGTPWMVSAVVDGVPVNGIAYPFGTLKAAAAAVESGEMIAEGLFEILRLPRIAETVKAAARTLFVEMLSTNQGAAEWMSMLARHSPRQLGLAGPSTIKVIPAAGQIEVVLADQAPLTWPRIKVIPAAGQIEVCRLEPASV